MNRWYVAMTQPKQEMLARSNLIEQGFDVFLPVTAQRRIVRKAQITILQPLFPSYVFVAFDTERHRWRCINSTRGVRRLLCQDSDAPSAVRYGVIENMRAAASPEGRMDSDVADDTLAAYAPGARLRVDSGPFEGLAGICHAATANRVSVLLSLLGRKTLVQLPTQQVVPAA